MKTNNKNKKPLHDSFAGRIIIGVIIGIILIFAGFWIKKHILTEPQQQQVPPQSPQLKLSDQNQTSRPMPTKSKKTIPGKTADTSLSAPTPENKQAPQQPAINAPNSVISINQQGGITAHTVNMAPQSRHVSPEQRAILVAALKPFCPQAISISYGEADPEQKKFAIELIDALRAADCRLEISSALLMLTPYEKGLTFEVNSAPPYPKGADILQRALRDAKIDSHWIGTTEIKRDVIWMVVGKQ